MPVIEGTTSLKSAVGEYDFAADGGAIGSITLRSSTINGNSIPAGSVITGGYIEIDTLFTTGTAATMAINLESAGDLVAATVVSGAPYSTTGRKSVIPAGTGATSVKTTVPRSLVATIAVGTVTAGKGRVVVFYR
jgi:hypothetical protein